MYELLNGPPLVGGLLRGPSRGLNYSLTTEVGSMLVTGRRCCLLKDGSIETLPTDLVGRTGKDVEIGRAGTGEVALHAWIRGDLGLGACSRCAV